MIILNLNTTRVFCTDFGATLDLFGAEKDNSSIDNYVVCIFSPLILEEGEICEE